MPLVRPGPPSKCEPFREKILETLDAGLSAQRIWQDLKADHGFTGSYQSVKRFRRRLGRKTELPFRRIETEPGQEVQVDYEPRLKMVYFHLTPGGALSPSPDIRVTRNAMWEIEEFAEPLLAR